MKHRSGFLLFINACIPGCGQMYQGYMKRGLSIMIGFCILIAIGSFLYIGELMLFLPVLWLYAFFDTYNLRAHLNSEETLPDEGIFGFTSVDAAQFGELFSKRRSFVGWILVISGIYALYTSFLRSTLSDLLDEAGLHQLYLFLNYDLPRMVGISAIILLGIWFIRGPKQSKSDTYTSFTPFESTAKQASPISDPAEFVDTAPTEDSPAYKKVSDTVAEIIRSGKENCNDGE